MTRLYPRPFPRKRESNRGNEDMHEGPLLRPLLRKAKGLNAFARDPLLAARAATFVSTRPLTQNTTITSPLQVGITRQRAGRSRAPKICCEPRRRNRPIHFRDNRAELQILSKRYAQPAIEHDPKPDLQIFITIGCNTVAALLWIGWVMKDRSRRHGTLKVIICGGVLAFAAAGAFVIRDRMASDPSPTGTIQISRQDSSCQRVVLDSSSGAIQSSQPIPCRDAPKIAPASVETAPPRYSSGGRVDAIRDSFRNR